MHAQMRPDGAIVLTIEDSELVDIESALMNAEDAATMQADDGDVDEDGADDLREAATWLSRLQDVIANADGRPPRAPDLRRVR